MPPAPFPRIAAAAQRMFGWTEEEAVGRRMRELIMPPEYAERHDTRRLALLDSPDPRATETFEVELVHRDGRRFPGEATVSKVEARGEVFASGFITDTTERLRRQAEREALLREQAARAEAERVAEVVGGMQALVDAALGQRNLEGILRDLVNQVRGVLDASAATIYLADEGGPAQRGGVHPVGRSRGRGVRDLGGGVARGDARAGGRADRRAAPRRGRGHGRAGGRGRAAPRVRGRGPDAPPACGRACGPRDRARTGLRAGAPDRGDAPAEPPARQAPGSPRARGGRALPARRLRGRGGRRLVRRDPDRRRRASVS